MANDTLERLQAFATQDVADEGVVSLQWLGSKKGWMFAAEWGREAADSPMAGAATYGNDDEVTACIEQGLQDVRKRRPQLQSEAGMASGTMSGAQLIAHERARQVGEEEYTAEHDDAHTDEELVMAAISYALPHYLGVPVHWPWQDSEWKPSGDRVKDMVKAGALIAAEIDRLQREREVTT